MEGHDLYGATRKGLLFILVFIKTTVNEDTKKTIEKLITYYGTEVDAIQAIRSGSIGNVPGIAFKQATRFAKNYFELIEKNFFSIY